MTPNPPRFNPRLRVGRRAGILRPRLNPPIGAPRIRLPQLRRNPPPLLLLPIRLEYRVVQVPVFRRNPDLREGRRLRPSPVPPGIRRNPAGFARRPNPAGIVLRPNPGGRPAALNPPIIARPGEAGTLRPASFQTQIWFRWYPEEDFAEDGVAAPDADEIAALTETKNLLAGRAWHAADDEVARIFEGFARQVGPERAVHLLRTDGMRDDPDWEARIGKLAVLPQRVHLFTLQGGEMRLLAKSASIARELAYDGELLDRSHWMFDFNKVVEKGLGLRIDDEALIERALEADGIVAVGLQNGDVRQAMTRLLEDGVASGSFSLLEQGAPTNNGVGKEVTELDRSFDLERFRLDASHLERVVHKETPVSDGDRLAEALGLDPGVVRPAVRSGQLGVADAQAMIKAIGPALLEQMVDRVTLFGSVDNDDVAEFLAEWISARGHLPALRFGECPYGVLPVSKPKASPQRPVAHLNSNDAIEQYLQRTSSFARGWLLRDSEAGPSPIQPGDVETSEKLEAALKLSAVSKRVDVSESQEEARPIGCPYVTHKNHRPAGYLHDLRTKNIDGLPDPAATNRTWPLLYRLIRQAATRRLVNYFVAAVPNLSASATTELRGIARRFNERLVTPRAERPIAARPRPNLVTDETRAIPTLNSIAGMSVASLGRSTQLAGLSGVESRRLVRVTRAFAEAIEHLEAIAARPDGDAQLERLMLETIDLVQYRTDAWASGLAYRSVAVSRRSGVKGLRGGWYGMLGKLRPESATGASDGYLQAPSMEQAVTTAVMRASHLRHRSSGAFDIDLSSARVRSALKLLDLISKGLSIQEVLGLVGERWLHEHKVDRLIADLRARFPIKDPDKDGSLEIRLFDGHAFQESNSLFGNSSDKKHLRQLRANLRDCLDGLTDLVMAEALHQRTLGNLEASQAWTQVLSGGAAPSVPAFVRTRRMGHGSSHSIMAVFEAKEAADSASPREVASPALAAAAAAAMPTFERCKVELGLLASGDLPGQAVRYALQADLGMTPLDLVVGGAEEIGKRAKARFLFDWQANGTGEPPHELSALQQEVSISCEVGPVRASKFLALAGALRAAMSRARMLDPSDLAASAALADPLDPADELLNWNEAVQVVAQRASLLATRLTALSTSLATVIDRTVVRAKNLMGAASDDARLGDFESSLAAARSELRPLLENTFGFGEQAALGLLAMDIRRMDPEIFDETGSALVARLRVKAAAFARASTSSAAATDVQEARQRGRDVIAVLQEALDGEALPIALPFAQRAGTKPKLSAAVSANTRLGSWSVSRPRVSAAVDFVSQFKLKVLPVSKLAYDDEAGDPTADQRPEDVAPRTAFYGTFLSTKARPQNLARVEGFVVDEWSESRPSSQQSTGLCVNYDAPQSEAPQCVLLCSPTAGASAQWTEKDASGYVHEVLQWMKVRARTSSGAFSWMSGANEVPRRQDGKRRIPRQQLLAMHFPDAVASGFVLRNNARHSFTLNEAILGEEL